MKRLVIACSLVTVTTVLLISCRNAKKTETTPTIVPSFAEATEGKLAVTSGDTHMTRKRTTSGLEYEVLKPGSGASPVPGNTVTVHYTGWLDNNGQQGKEFDSSFKRNQPFSFVIGVHQVIQGWDEGVMTMKVGEKRRLFISSALGYGARGAGAVIPPNANLIFEVELLKIS